MQAVDGLAHDAVSWGPRAVVMVAGVAGLVGEGGELGAGGGGPLLRVCLLPPPMAPRGEIVCLRRWPRGDCDVRGCDCSSGVAPSLCRDDRSRAVYFTLVFFVCLRSPDRPSSLLRYRPRSRPRLGDPLAHKWSPTRARNAPARGMHCHPVPSLSCATVVQ